MKCKKCGSELKGEWMFCPDCGERLMDEMDLFSSSPVLESANEDKADDENAIDHDEVMTEEDDLDYDDEDDEDDLPMNIDLKELEKFMSSKKNETDVNQISLKKNPMNHMWISKIFFYTGILLFLAALMTCITCQIILFTTGKLSYGLSLCSIILSCLSNLLFVLAMVESHKAKEKNVLILIFLIFNIAVLLYTCIYLFLDLSTYNEESVFSYVMESYDFDRKFAEEIHVF